MSLSLSFFLTTTQCSPASFFTIRSIYFLVPHPFPADVLFRTRRKFRTGVQEEGEGGGWRKIEDMLKLKHFNKRKCFLLSFFLSFFCSAVPPRDTETDIQRDIHTHTETSFPQHPTRHSLPVSLSLHPLVSLIRVIQAFSRIFEHSSLLPLHRVTARLSFTAGQERRRR